jgi:RNA polymerase sigma factor (sigma-70 family)
MTSVQAADVLQHIRRLGGTRLPAEPTDAHLLERFTAQRDEASFAVLVRRHGPMVLNVCRGVLRHEQDAEDAFQATFVVLARKADSLRQPGAVASFLYQVAHRVAIKAQAGAARRRAQEQRMSPMAEDVDPTLDMTLRDLHGVLHEELLQLPDKYRLPLVLCYLEGRSQEEAAQMLGLSKGTCRGRLDRGREHLRRRLVLRGVTLSAVLTAAVVAPRTVAQPLVDSVVESAVGGSVTLSARAVTLAEGVIRGMSTGKIKVGTLLLFAVALVAAAGALAREAMTAREQATTSQKSEDRGQKPAADEKGDSVEVRGRVVDPAGKPVAGAKVYFARYILPDPPAQPSDTATSDAEGRFRLRVSRLGYSEQYMKARWMQGAVVAVGQGTTFGWAGAFSAEKLTNTTIKLGKEVPITGRVLDLEGKPIAGVSVQVRGVRVRQDGGDLKDLVARLKKESPNAPHHPEIWLHPVPLGLTRTAVTTADGKFRLTGIPGECLVCLRFAGPTIETTEVYSMTRPAPTIVTNRSWNSPDLGKLVFHGQTFDHAAAPTRPIRGMVRDRDSGKPLAGVTIRARMGPVGASHFVGDPYLEATTNTEGRYQLVGLTREAGHRVEVLPPSGQPYLRSTRKSPAAARLDPLTMDFTLKRGVLIRGRVTDKETGQPVPALVRYLAFYDNPHLKEAPGFRNSEEVEARTTKDGSFTLVGLPGRGLLAVKAADRKEGRYLMACGADRIKGPRFDRDHFNTEPSACNPAEFNTLVALDPARDAGSIVQNLVLDPGKTVTGTIVDPDGKPVTGVRFDGAVRDWFNRGDLPTAQFRIHGVDPAHPRWFIFRHRGRNLGAIVQIKGNEPMPVTVRLQKCATVTGRVVDDDGEPRACWLMGGYHKGKLFGDSIGISIGMRGLGKDGRFRIEGVVPGWKIGLYVGKNTTFFDPLVPELTLKAGEVKELGDAKAKES